MEKPKGKARRHASLVVVVMAIVYVLSYVALTRILSPAIPTPFGPMIGLGAPRGFESATEPPTAEDIRASKRRITTFHMIYGPLIWVDEHITGTYFGTAEEIYGG